VHRSDCKTPESKYLDISSLKEDWEQLFVAVAKLFGKDDSDINELTLICTNEDKIKPKRSDTDISNWPTKLDLKQLDVAFFSDPDISPDESTNK